MCVNTVHKERRQRRKFASSWHEHQRRPETVVFAPRGVTSPHSSRERGGRPHKPQVSIYVSPNLQCTSICLSYYICACIAEFSRRRAEYSFETNAAPVGGCVGSDLREMTAGQDAVLLQTMAWTDDFEDLPLAYEFGHAPGWVRVSSVPRCEAMVVPQSLCPPIFYSLRARFPPSEADECCIRP